MNFLHYNGLPDWVWTLVFLNICLILHSAPIVTIGALSFMSTRGLMSAMFGVTTLCAAILGWFSNEFAGVY